MTAAIHTRYQSGKIRAWTKTGKGEFNLLAPYDFAASHNDRHPAVAKQLAERLGWSGLWIVGHNDDCSVACVQPVSTPYIPRSDRDLYGVEGRDWFFVEPK